MTVKELIEHLQALPEDKQQEEILYRQKGGKLGKVDYTVRETNGTRVVMSEEWI